MEKEYSNKDLYIITVFDIMYTKRLFTKLPQIKTSTVSFKQETLEGATALANKQKQHTVEIIKSANKKAKVETIVEESEDEKGIRYSNTVISYSPTGNNKGYMNYSLISVVHIDPKQYNIPSHLKTEKYNISNSPYTINISVKGNTSPVISFGDFGKSVDSLKRSINDNQTQIQSTLTKSAHTMGILALPILKQSIEKNTIITEYGPYKNVSGNYETDKYYSSVWDSNYTTNLLDREVLNVESVKESESIKEVLSET